MEHIFKVGDRALVRGYCLSRSADLVEVKVVRLPGPSSRYLVEDESGRRFRRGGHGADFTMTPVELAPQFNVGDRVMTRGFGRGENTAEVAVVVSAFQGQDAAGQRFTVKDETGLEFCRPAAALTLIQPVAPPPPQPTAEERLAKALAAVKAQLEQLPADYSSRSTVEDCVLEALTAVLRDGFGLKHRVETQTVVTIAYEEIAQ